MTSLKIDKSAPIFVAGHNGLVGSAIVRRLKLGGYTNILVAERSDIDLCKPDTVTEFLSRYKPSFIFMAAAKVGGIHANNSYPAEFIFNNLMIECNLVDGAYRAGVERMLFLGSSCIYPKFCPQPMKEEHLLTGLLEPTNEPYAVAKIAGLKLCEAYNRQYGTKYISAMPTNLYGPNDNFHLENSHVLPALIRRFIEAVKTDAGEVTVWGSGTPRREFLYVDDLADACVFIMENGITYDRINIGVGEDVTIRQLAEIIKRVVGFDGALKFDATKPDGTPQKLLDVSRLTNLGWKSKVGLEEGIQRTYQWYKNSEQWRD